MTTAVVMVALVAVVALALLAYLGWRWWQAQVGKAAGQHLQEAAWLAAALALSDPKAGGQLLWEAGEPRYYPAPESTEQEKALLHAWEMALEQQWQARQGRRVPLALPQGLDTLMPDMLPAANLGLYTAQPRNWAQARRNLSALAATSVLMERRAGRWLEVHGPLLDELSRELQQQSTLEAVSVESWRKRTTA